MQKTYTYQEIVDGLNDGSIKKVCFAVENYGHYSDCVAEGFPADCRQNAEVVFRLTPDGNETCVFCRRVNPDEKIFVFKGKGKYSLRQIWNKIVVKSVVYFEE